MEKRTIRFGDVSFDYQAKERIRAILESGRNTEGEWVSQFERAFAAKFGFKFAVMTSSGTTAGEVAWMAAGCLMDSMLYEDQQLIVTPALSFVATANCIKRSGLWPHFIDISESLNISEDLDWDDLNSKQGGISGIQFVLNMGRTIGLAEAERFATREGLFLLVDACEGHGARLNNWPIADLCDAAIYSFYPAHIMTVGGEGGMIATDNREFADLCRSIKSHGRPAGSIKHEFQRIGTNAKSTEIAAAVGLSALENFDKNFARRREIREMLLTGLGGLPVRTFRDAENEIIAPHAFPVLVENLAELQAHLTEWRIEWKPLWGALTNHPACANGHCPAGTFPVAEDIGGHGLHFGCHESMSDDDVEYIINVFKELYKS